jgi:hypothetical protein
VVAVENHSMQKDTDAADVVTSTLTLSQSIVNAVVERCAPSRRCKRDTTITKMEEQSGQREESEVELNNNNNIMDRKS